MRDGPPTRNPITKGKFRITFFFCAEIKSKQISRSVKGARTKSPESSLSSARGINYNRREIFQNVEKPKLSPRRTKPTTNSRSSSAGSKGSSTTRSKKSDNLRNMVKSSEADFKSLEERMQWLQKLLKAQ